MKFWSTTFKILGYTWIGLAGLIILLGYLGILLTDGSSSLEEIISPFNVINVIAAVVTLAPGVGLLELSKRFKRKTGLTFR